ncbi:MAG: pyruvate kinase [Propionibacteriaceae bacterium]
MRRAKIVCTLGPATSTPERIRELVDAGMDVARFNMSHGDQADKAQLLKMVRDAAVASGRAVGCLADLQGPKIRLGRFAAGPHQLAVGDTFTITIDDIQGTAERVSTTYKGLPQDVKPGDFLLIDDGKVTLEAVEVTATDVICCCVVAGAVSDSKGINLPGVAVSVPAMSEKDESDLRWALKNGFDIVALSFVRDAADVKRVREIMAEEGRNVPVVAKIEKPQALANLDAIIDAFDAFMVARGDLGVELPLEEVPVAQKKIVSAARKWAKPVIVATQMLESMISAPRPTRAEASDVANAVIDGADAVMLSGETSVGDYPILTVETMARIVESTEAHALEQIREIDWDPHTTGGVIAKAAAEVAERLEARYLVSFTKSGDSARRISRLRMSMPVLAFTPDEKVRQELTMSWGTQTFLTPKVSDTDAMVAEVEKTLRSLNMVESGDNIVVVAGYPMDIVGNTNCLRVHKIS